MTLSADWSPRKAILVCDRVGGHAGSVGAWHRLQHLTFVQANDACRSGHGRHSQGQPRVARSAADSAMLPGGGPVLGGWRGPVVLDDDPVANDFARVISDVGLVERVLDITAGGGEVGEVHHGREVEIALKVAGVVAPGEGEQLRYGAQRVERVEVPLFRLW